MLYKKPLGSMIDSKGIIVGLHEKAPSKGAEVNPTVVFENAAGDEITFTAKTERV